MSKQLQDTFAAKFHNIFCWIVIKATRYGTGLRGMVMSYSDPGIIVAFWVIVGGSFLNMLFFPIPLFAYIAYTFYKYNQKKLFYYYLIPIIIGPIMGISNFIEDYKSENYEQSYSKYQDQLKKVFCNEQSRKDFSSDVTPALRQYFKDSYSDIYVGRMTKYQYEYEDKNKHTSLTNFSSFLKNENLQNFVKKYPDLSNITFTYAKSASDYDPRVNLYDFVQNSETMFAELRKMRGRDGSISDADLAAWRQYKGCARF